MTALLALSFLFGADAPSDSCLTRVAALVARCAEDLPAMRGPAEEAAARLARGGRLFASGAPGMVSELTGRAGGFMMIRSLGKEIPGPDDVVMHTPAPGLAAPEALAGSAAFVAVFGGPEPGLEAPAFVSHAEAFGVSPSLAAAAPAWLFTGELIAALTRLGKMPVLYESIGAYGGNARMTQFKNGEIGFHENPGVPPVAPGVLGARYAAEIGRMLGRIEREEREKLETAGRWAREAREGGKKLWMYSMGHIFPDEVEKTALGTVFASATWNAGFRVPHPEDAYAPGDFIAHIGYQHPPDILLRKAVPAGARVAYVSVRPDRDFMGGVEGAVWIDSMWDWPDACVPVEGYDVPALAASGIVNGAVAWEIYRLLMAGE